MTSLSWRETMRPLIFMVSIFSTACIVPNCNVTLGPLRPSSSLQSWCHSDHQGLHILESLFRDYPCDEAILGQLTRSSRYLLRCHCWRDKRSRNCLSPFLSHLHSSLLVVHPSWCEWLIEVQGCHMWFLTNPKFLFLFALSRHVTSDQACEA